MRTLGGLALLLVALCPTWIFFLLKYFLNPQGFWQNFVLLGVGFWILGGFQVILLVAWIGLCIAMLIKWSESSKVR